MTCVQFHKFPAVLVAALIFSCPPLATAAERSAQPDQSHYLEDLTWVEVRDAIRDGKTTAIVPSAGLEQNGPHMVLGKHTYIVRHAAAQIAEILGDALVAPVISYVPEGTISPPGGHMRFAGTISLPPGVFADILEHAARSLRVHGFTTIAFLGDSGGNQAPQAAVAKKLNEEWAGSGVRVLHVSNYYTAADAQMERLVADGETVASVGKHAGIRDTSELMAIHPAGVRRNLLAPGNTASGNYGDSTRASPERGQELLRLRIEAAVRQIHKLRTEKR